MPDKKTPDWINDDEDLEPSKSALKRQMHSLQQLGESLLELSDQQIANIPIEDEQLLDALADCKRIKSNSARKRQLQFIGKLMRSIDSGPIEQAIASVHQQQQTATEGFHQLEILRDKILADGDSGIEMALQEHPTLDRQHLRQLVRQHQREVKQNKAPAAARKLFRHLREELLGS
jgi:ribosome-associated protein